MKNCFNIALLTGQGVWSSTSRTFHSEYPSDNNVFLEHVLNARKAFKFPQCWLVLSGGLTQKECASISESESYKSLLLECNECPCPPDNIVTDTRALDSAENFIMGLQAARMALGPDALIGHITIYSAWAGKKRRFTDLARFLQLSSRVSFVGHAPWSAAARPDLAEDGENAQVRRIGTDYLLTGAEWEDKRRQRYSGLDYEGRLAELSVHFSEYYQARAEFQVGDSASEARLTRAFLNETGPFA